MAVINAIVSSSCPSCTSTGSYRNGVCGLCGYRSPGIDTSGSIAVVPTPGGSGASGYGSGGIKINPATNPIKTLQDAAAVRERIVRALEREIGDRQTAERLGDVVVRELSTP